MWSPRAAAALVPSPSILRMRTLALALAFLSAPLAAQPAFATPITGGSGFVDLSPHLGQRDVTVAIGTIDRLKDGKRERLKDGTDLGGLGSSMQVSGTVFYKIQATFAPKLTEVLAGDPLKSGTRVHCELQAATLPSGERQQRFRTESRALADEDALALFVLRKGKRGFEVAEVVVADPALDKGAGESGDLAASFTKRAHDVFAVSQRMHRLRDALEVADSLLARDTKASATVPLRDLLAEKPSLAEPTHEAWLSMHCGPLERALKDKLAKLPAPKEGEGAGK